MNARGRCTVVWIGGLCLLAGVGLGHVSARGGPSVWSDPGPSPGQSSGHAGPAVPGSFADVVERVGPAVVAVRAMVPAGDASGEAGEAGGTISVRGGSGFVLHRTGLVVTARHLTLRANRLFVEVPRRGRYDAELVGEDDVTDLAVLRLIGPLPDLPTLPLGRSEDLRAGDWIVAVGNPFGFTQTVTAGVVSFVGRHLRHYDLRVSSDFLQFSAPVNPGSSGCPVVDLEGRVVGVTTQAAEAAQGISFAIPSRTLKWVLDAMDRSEDGRVHRGHLGISFDSVTGADASGSPTGGAVVRRVAEGGAAQGAGLRPGDVVLHFDGQPIADAGELYERITRTAPGSEVELTVRRGDRVLEPLAVVLRDAASREREGDPVH
jgi:serine protease Do